jgi:hypothetical protein
MAGAGYPSLALGDRSKLAIPIRPLPLGARRELEVDGILIQQLTPVCLELPPVERDPAGVRRDLFASTTRML